MKNNIIAELKIIPIGTDGASLSRFVKASTDIVKETQGIEYRHTPMATIVQGPLEVIIEMAKRMHEVPFNMGVSRVLTSIVIDDRRDKEVTLDSKVEAIS